MDVLIVKSFSVITPTYNSFTIEGILCRKGWGIPTAAIFIQFSKLAVLLFTVCCYPGWMLSHDTKPHKKDFHVENHNLWKRFYLFVWGSVHLIMWWHFKSPCGRQCFDISGQLDCHDIWRWQVVNLWGGLLRLLTDITNEEWGEENILLMKTLTGLTEVMHPVSLLTPFWLISFSYSVFALNSCEWPQTFLLKSIGGLRVICFIQFDS